ncbi:MAG: YegS/Rv2252/BmrU family lipid kinase [Actinomycetota bacterium]
MTRPDWFVLLNPHAGRDAASRADVEAAFARHGVGAHVTTTRSVDHLRSVVADEIRRGTRRFAVVGGDGTAHHALNAMLKPESAPSKDLMLSIIPSGSGSDFIRTFGHARGLDAGVARLRQPDPYRIDIGQVTGSFGKVYFLNALNVGVAAASAAAASRLPRRLGPKRYAIGFWLALARFQQGSITANIDRHTFTGEAINVVVANGQFFGGGMNVAPRATLTDGLFDVQVFQGPRRRAFSVMPRVITGSHLTHAAVRRYIGSDVHLAIPDDWPVEADGEMLGTGAVQAATIPSAIDFIA